LNLITFHIGPILNAIGVRIQVSVNLMKK